jgi:hypothetical protein
MSSITYLLIVLCCACVRALFLKCQIYGVVQKSVNLQYSFVSVGKPEGTDHQGDLDVGLRIIYNIYIII